MERFRLIFIPLFLLAINLSAQKIPNLQEDFYIRETIKAIANENYNKADSLLKEFKKDFPGSPFPYIYLAANNINRKFNFHSAKYNDVIYYNISKAGEIADSLIMADNRNIWNYYAKALALGYWAYFEGIKGNYFSSFDYGSEALDYYDKCLELDSSFADAKIANAIYDYWISDKLGWLPFVKDKRADAIKVLYEMVKAESYNQNLAAVSLFWILMNEHNYAEAKKIIVAQSDKYPENRYLLMARANVEKRFDAEKAKRFYLQALELTLSKERENRINEIILRHKIAMLEFKLKNYDNVLEQCDIVMSYKLSDYEKNELKERLRKISELKKNAERRKHNATTN